MPGGCAHSGALLQGADKDICSNSMWQPGSHSAVETAEMGPEAVQAQQSHLELMTGGAGLDLWAARSAEVGSEKPWQPCRSLNDGAEQVLIS